MTDPQPISVAEAREMVDAHAGIPPDTDVHMSNESAARLWQRILATAQQAERRWVPVSERLPEKPMECWVYSGIQYSPWPAKWTGTAFEGQPGNELLNITHWQPFIVPDQPEV